MAHWHLKNYINNFIQHYVSVNTQIITKKHLALHSIMYGNTQIECFNLDWIDFEKITVKLINFERTEVEKNDCNSLYKE